MIQFDFKLEDCEVSDDQVLWKPAVGNVGRYVRVRPDAMSASLESSGFITDQAYGGFSISVGIDPVNKLKK